MDAASTSGGEINSRQAQATDRYAWVDPEVLGTSSRYCRETEATLRATLSAKEAGLPDPKKPTRETRKRKETEISASSRQLSDNVVSSHGAGNPASAAGVARGKSKRWEKAKGREGDSDRPPPGCREFFHASGGRCHFF
ncbi:hypothetical protein SESBI_29959 [Sesbania bispinosa]|nr:hypothetical protein SESBI_29959 [Sesbania bispinosa]